MPDRSFKTWQIVLDCDHPGHRKTDPSFPDITETAHTETTREGYRAQYRRDGWIFHRDGRLTCPDCAPEGPGMESEGR